MIKTVNADARTAGRGITHDLRPEPHRDVRGDDTADTYSVIVESIPYTNLPAGTNIGNSGYYTDIMPTDETRAPEHGVEHDIRNPIRGAKP
jgi:hypothetical protein